MKLVTRLTVAFLMVVLLVISLHEARRVRQALDDFEGDTDRAHLLVAATLADAVALAATVEGADAAHRIVASTAERHGELRIRWVCTPGKEEPPPGELTCADLDTAPAPVTLVAESRRSTLAPVRIDGRFSGAIEVSEPPEHEGLWVRQHVREALILALMTVIATALAAFGLGWWLVARPTRALVQKARDVGRGDLEPNLQLGTSDELGDLASEMNAMCTHLREARESAAREAGARLEATEQLRHADRLATVGRLASGLAHELGTPLNVIEARAGLIIDDPASDEPVRSSAKVIIGCSEQMTRLVRQLLVFARTRSLEKGQLALDGLANTVVELVRPLATKRQVTLATAPLEPVTVEADAVLLQQAVTNLVINAVQACEAPGAVTVSTTTQSATRPGHDVPTTWRVLAVKDDGPGMAPEVRDRVFEPFFTTKAPGEGTGLGLAVAWGIVEEHGGWISVESALGHGTTFRVHLPGDAR